jgi:hypothetical protein
MVQFIEEAQRDRVAIRHAGALAGIAGAILRPAREAAP